MKTSIIIRLEDYVWVRLTEEGEKILLEAVSSNPCCRVDHYLEEKTNYYKLPLCDFMKFFGGKHYLKRAKGLFVNDEILISPPVL